MRGLRGLLNGYGLEESSEVMRGGKICPRCGEPMSRQARFCRECTIGFRSFLRKIYGRGVIFARAKEPTGGRRAAGERSRRRTLVVLRSNGPSTSVELARATGMTAQGIREQMKILKEAEKVTLMGEGYRHTWIAKEIAK